MRRARLRAPLAGLAGAAALWAAAVAAQVAPVGGPAPEIAGQPWINGGPLTLHGLRGRVVLVEFWTYG